MIEENVPLAPYTTFRLGGPGRFFARVASLGELKESLDFARDKNLPTQILGGGSNVLVRDEGYEGLVIKIEFSGVERTGRGYIAAAGESWDALVARAVGDGLWGIENLSGIPGTVGGACVQNIGAYGAALSQVIEWVEVFDTTTGQVMRLDNAQCAFGYRDSVFKKCSAENPRSGEIYLAPARGFFAPLIVLRAALSLSAAPRPNLAYADLAARFKGSAPSLGDIRAAVLDIRAHKFPDLGVEGTAGSFFLNPIVPAAEAALLRVRYPDMPLFAMPETTHVKAPLGWLLDKALNLKGYAVGGARLFERQALVIVASRTASANDVLALRDSVKKIVRDTIGIDIKEEVTIV